MTTYVAVIERDVDTGYFVGYVPNFPGAHSQGRRWMSYTLICAK